MDYENKPSPPPRFLKPVGKLVSFMYSQAAKRGFISKAKDVTSPNIVESTIKHTESIKLGLNEFEQNYGAQTRELAPLKDAIISRTGQISYYEVAKKFIEKLDLTDDLYRRYLSGGPISTADLDDLETRFAALKINFDIMDAYVRPENWMDLSKIGRKPIPVRQNSKILLSLGQIIFLTALVDVAKQVKETMAPEESSEYDLHLLKETDKALIEINIDKSLEAGIGREIVDEARLLLYQVKIGYFPENVKTLPLEQIFSRGRAMHLAHFASAQTNARLHHSAYIGHMLIVECFLNKFTESKHKSALVMSIKNVFDVLINARNRKSPLFYIPYANSYPFRALRKRALWTVGLFPSYDLFTNNCESPVSWIFENQLLGDPTHCIIGNRRKELYTNREINRFWSNIVDKTKVAPINFNTSNILGSLVGEGGRRTRKNSKKYRSSHTARKRYITV